MFSSYESPLLPSPLIHKDAIVIPNETFPGMRGNGEMRDLPREAGKYLTIVLPDDECINVLKADYKMFTDSVQD